MNYQIFYKIFTLMLSLSLCGCQSISTGAKHICHIYLESTGNSSVVKTLPISQIDIPVIPVPVLSNDGIAGASVVAKRYGSMLEISFTDKAMYELYRLSFDSIGRRLLLEYDGDIIAFSQVSCENIQSVVFIPEASDKTCQSFCQFINNRRGQ